MHRSIATIDAPQFINLQPLDINPMMSKCEIKVLYIGANRNHSYITKEVATEMAKTLRGAPIVGYYKEEKEDFADHGEQVIFDDEGIHFNCLTKPYGFVAPDAEIWFQKFIDTDDFGNDIEREYLMTTGYLWTGQFEEAKAVVENGKPQSMELDEATLEGRWEYNMAEGMEYFIIDDAMFSKLCILGDDVEPCFEGASVTEPQVSTSFTKVDDTFVRTLYTMMQDLKSALETQGGQSKMELENNELENNEVVESPVVEETPVAEEVPAVEEPAVEEEVPAEENAEAASNGEIEEESTEEPAASEFAKKEDEEDEEEKPEDKEEEPAEEDDKEEEEDEEKKKAAKNSLLEEEHEALKAEFTALKAAYDELVEFKNQIDNEKKDELIASFYMLSDEDKQDVVENKSKYSLEEIKSKLAVICFDKKVNFDLDDNSKNEERVEDNKNANVTTFSLDNENNGVPAWIKAVVNNRNK